MRANSLTLRFLAMLLAACAGASAAARADTAEKVGVNAAVNTNANGTPPSGVTKRLVIGEDIVHNERVTTDANGQTQILFIDGSSVSVGPNSDLTIDEFVFDPKTGAGKMTLTDLQGALRFVGGKLSKQEDAVSVHLGTATIGVRGGIFLANTQRGGASNVIFVFGNAVTVTGGSGSCGQQLYRPGFEVSISKPGGCPDSPHLAPPGAMSAILLNLDGSIGRTGGATTIPTNATIAASTVPNTISNNVQISLQQAANNAGPIVAPPTPVVSPPQVPSNQVQTTSSQTQPIVSNPIPPAPPTPPQPVVIQIAGLVKVAPHGSTLGFTDQSAAGRVPYTGSITYPAGSDLQNGVATGADTAGAVFTLSPLTAGATTNVTATATTANSPATGTATETSDGDFFFANLNATTGGQSIFAFGGTPVAQSFFAPQPNAQILAFNVLPDASLGSNGQPQTIPFLPAAFGGTMANAAVSPLYLATIANSPFGSFNENNNPDGTAPHYLQANLAVNGQGASQSSALVIMTGGFDTSNAGSVYGSGPVRGVVLTSATGPLIGIEAGSATVPDANGNNLFGGSTIDGFVLDQNQYSNGALSLDTATALPVSQTYGSGGQPFPTYAFNQPVTATSLPTNVGVTRSALNETGFFGGIMELGGFYGAPTSYALTGITSVQTFPSDNRVAATFVGTDPFTPAQSDLSSLVLQFGNDTTGLSNSRTTFIDNNIYAAAENPNIASTITTTNGTTTTLPTEESGSTLFPRLAMVTSATLGPNANSWMPAGVTPCSCQYLQWGYWTGRVGIPNTPGASPTYSRVDQGAINTWIAGQPTVTMPTTGMGTYNGAAVGTVFNNGATYLAAGNFSANYNFGNNTGAVNISNFDGASYTAAVSGSGGAYTGTLTGVPSRTGSVIGRFYGPNAVETGGAFGVHSISGPSYLASGIFAGR